jgi:hypothetical protein
MRLEITESETKVIEKAVVSLRNVNDMIYSSGSLSGSDRGIQDTVTISLNASEINK